MRLQWKINNCLVAKIRALFLVALLFGTSILASQTRQEIFERSIDFVNCKMVRFSIERSEDPHRKLESFNKRFNNCELYENENFNFQGLIDFLNNMGLSKTVDLAVEVNSAKNNFNSSWDANGIMTFLSTVLMDDEKQNYPKINIFKNKHGKDYLDLKQQVLEGSLRPFLIKELRNAPQSAVIVPEYVFQKEKDQDTNTPESPASQAEERNVTPKRGLFSGDGYIELDQ